MSAFYQVFQLYCPLMKFPGIGVALRALELPHLVPTFILRGRGLLNLLHLRSDRLSTSSPTRSSSLWVHRDTKICIRIRQCAKHSSAQPHTAISAIRHFSPCSRCMVSGEAYYYASYVSIQLDNPNDNRNQRQHQRHLPFLLLPLTALPFRFGLTLATPPLHHPHLHSSILPLLLHPTSTPTTPKSQTKHKAQSNISFPFFFSLRQRFFGTEYRSTLRIGLQLWGSVGV